MITNSENGKLIKLLLLSLTAEQNNVVHLSQKHMYPQQPYMGKKRNGMRFQTRNLLLTS